MRFEWDEQKNRRNRAKHKIGFETASLVFEDPWALSNPDRVVEGEERWQTMGLIDAATVVVVAHACQQVNAEEMVRIISARKATPHERRVYEENRGTAARHPEASKDEVERD
jgi:uncharacterized protein